MSKPKISIELREGIVFTVSTQSMVGKDLTIFAIDDIKTGERLYEKTYNIYVGLNQGQVLRRHIKEMYLEEYYKTPEVYWSDARGSKTLAYLSAAYSVCGGSLREVLEKDHFRYREIVSYSYGSGESRKCEIETRRYSSNLVTRRYRFLKGEMLTSLAKQKTGSTAIQNDRERELVFVRHFTKGDALLTADEVYQQNNHLVTAFITIDD